MAQAAVISGLLDYLVDELRAHSPFTMARLAEYGKVGGYATRYAALRAEISEVCFALADALPAFDPGPLKRLPPPPVRRILVETFFLDEQTALIGVLADAKAAVAATPTVVFEEALMRLDRRRAARLEEAIGRSGVRSALPPPEPQSPRPARPAQTPEKRPEPRLAPDAPPPRRLAGRVGRDRRPPETGAPEPGAAPSDGASIYVSSRFAPELGEQISAFLSIKGLRPVPAAGALNGAGRRANGAGAVSSGGAPRAGAVDLHRAEAAIRSCAGGFFSLVLPGVDAVSTGGRALSLSDALAVCLPELSVAQRHLGRRMVIIARRDSLAALPGELRAHPIFALHSSVMNDQEFSTFVSMAARTSWLRG